MDKLKVAFVGLYKEANLGDPVILDCTEWLYKKYLKANVAGTKRLYLDYIQKTYKLPFHLRVGNKLLHCIHQEKRIARLFEKRIKDEYRDYFLEGIKGCDLAVVVGGGIVKWSNQYFNEGLAALLQAGEKLNIPIVLNAVGVEGYNENDLKCQVLKKTLQSPALIHISTRDDLDTLVSKYYDGAPHCFVSRVADPAVWADEVYGKKKISSQVIGIGIARGGIFQDYGINYTPSEIKELYKGIIQTLVAKGRKVEVFTNGFYSDNGFADIVCAELQNEGLDVQTHYPTNPKELVELIGSYEGIIATRLHSCIIAYSLEIPVVGLVWNDKLKFFGRNINEESNFITFESFNVSAIISQLEYAIAKGYEQHVRSEFRETIIKDIMMIDAGKRDIAHINMGG